MKNISPTILIGLVHKKLEKKIPLKYIKPVVLIFLDELRKDLLENRNTFIIENFGKIKYSLPKPKKHHSIISGKLEESFGNPLLKFELFKFIRRRILSLIDIDKTFRCTHFERNGKLEKKT